MSSTSKPFIVDGHGQSQFGRFHLPFIAANIADSHVLDYARWLRVPRPWNMWARAWRLKEWHFLSLNHEDVFVAFAVAQLGYVSNLFIYCFDKRTGRMQEWGGRFLFGRKLRFGSSSIAGLTSWLSRSHQLRIENQDQGWNISLRAGNDLDIDCFMRRDEAMALVFPLATNRAGYTHKEVGNRVTGRMRWGGEDFQLTPNNCLGASDWSRSFSDRVTQWYFACFGGFSSTGQRLGLNLSRLIYDDTSGSSQENTIWVDGRSYPTGAARFELPETPHLQTRPWTIQAFDPEDSRRVIADLRFEPLGARKENVSLGILTSRFTQAFGYYSGTLTIDGKTHTLPKTFGVAEKHYSKW